MNDFIDHNFDKQNIIELPLWSVSAYALRKTHSAAVFKGRKNSTAVESQSVNVMQQAAN